MRFLDRWGLALSFVVVAGCGSADVAPERAQEGENVGVATSALATTNDAIKREIESKGVWVRPSDYDAGGYPITKGLIEDGRKHLLLGGLIETRCPVHILQGVKDPDVPWQHAQELVTRFARDDVVLTLIKDGDHRLSRPEDIERLIAAVKEF